MATNQNQVMITQQKPWELYERIIFRAFFLFTIIITIPYKPIRFIDSATNIGVSNRYYLGSFLSRGENERDFLPFLYIFVLLFVIAYVWEFIDKKHKQYNTLYYWIWVLARFKVADVMFWFGIEKVFPIQMPFPTESYLNTNLGDIHPWKLYWLTTGASPNFQIFCGLFEVLAASLLIFRRTAVLGALAMLSITVPIIAINIAYDAGVQKPAFTLLLLLGVVIAYDFKGLWNFFILRKQVALRKFPDLFTKKWQKIVKWTAFTLFIISAVVFRGIGMYDWYVKGESDKLPKKKGVKEFVGYYRVPDFVLNNKSLPFSYTDTVRWQDVVFEKWNTISIRTARPILLKKGRQSARPLKETLGIAGRHYYFYDVDTLEKTIKLKYKTDTTQQFYFKYDDTKTKKLFLSGVNESGDSVKVSLDKVDKKYPLLEGRNKDKVYYP